MKKLPIFLLWLICSLPIKAQMTLNDCLIYARDHAHSNRLSRLDTEAAKADKRMTTADLLPYIGFGSNGSLSFGRNIDPETNTYDNKRTLATGFGIDFSLPLFDGLVRINNLKAAKVAELRSQKRELAEQDRVSLEVIKAFYNVSYCRAMVEQMERQIKRDSTLLLATEREEGLGTKSGADVAEIKAIVASDVYELANQSNLLKKAHLSLRRAMGMPPSDEPLFLLEQPLGSPDNITGTILPELAEAELAVKESRHYLNSAKGGYSPRLSFGAGISTSYYKMVGDGVLAPSFSEQFRNNMGEYFNLSLSWTIFDGLATTNRIRKAKMNYLSSQTRLEETRFQIRQATEEALLDKKAAEEELTAAESRVAAEEIAYNAVRRKFDLGMASAIDLYTSSSNLATARANLEGKRIQRIIAEILMRYYQGYPLISH